MRIARWGIVLAGACLLTATGARAQEARTGPPASPGSRPEDERALRALAERYAAAYKAGDAAGLSALFTDDAEMIDENGDRLRGRRAIQDVFAAIFRNRPGATLAITPASLRFLAPDVAQEEGHTVVKAGSEGPSTRKYTVLFIKQGDIWRYSSVREERDSGASPHQHLEELAWLVGDWTDESPDSVVQTTCNWSPDGHFLLRDFNVRVQGKSVMTVNERIGWDAQARQIRSWVFDSEGGHGSGLWSRAGDRWVIKSSGVLPDGRLATATHTLTKVNSNSARWSSVERTVGDRVVPDRAEYVMVRKPPQPSAR
jgi:uncharacterized protein (TIGR02246 family)